MSLRLHNPASQAHIEELKDRLRSQLALVRHRPYGDSGQDALVERLVQVVRSMDQGRISTQEAMETFTRHRISGFSFVRWLVDMVDEGVYLDTRFDDTRFRQAA
jgi:hypothetical protein